jgi:phage shock protein A
MTVQNIKREIEMLSPGEVSELQDWLNQQERDEAKVDMQLRDAVDAGKFDKLIEEVIADEKDRLTTPL